MIWWARYIGLPFVPFGRGPRDFDCWGLVRQVFIDQMGVELPEHGGISPDEVGKISSLMNKPGPVWTQTHAPKAMDVMTASARPGSIVPCHAGVMVDSNRVLHVSSGTNSCVMSVDHLFLRGRVIGYWRYCQK